MVVYEEWNFKDKKNTVVFTTRKIINGKMPILYVSHDEEDGVWQFLNGEAIDIEDAAIVALSEIVNLDNSLNQLFDLPLGWIAYRNSCSATWNRRRR